MSSSTIYQRKVTYKNRLDEFSNYCSTSNDGDGNEYVHFHETFPTRPCFFEQKNWKITQSDAILCRRGVGGKVSSFGLCKSYMKQDWEIPKKEEIVKLNSKIRHDNFGLHSFFGSSHSDTFPINIMRFQNFVQRAHY
jgi:hypothetical protein